MLTTGSARSPVELRIPFGRGLFSPVLCSSYTTAICYLLQLRILKVQLHVSMRVIVAINGRLLTIICLFVSTLVWE